MVRELLRCCIGTRKTARLQRLQKDSPTLYGLYHAFTRAIKALLLAKDHFRLTPDPASSPTGLNGPIALAQNHRLFSKSPSVARDPYCFAQKSKSDGTRNNAHLQLENGTFDPCKSVFISVLCGEVLGPILLPNAKKRP